MQATAHRQINELEQKDLRAGAAAYGRRMVVDESQLEKHWVRTTGAQRPGDPRDGELHQFFGRLRDSFYLEPSDSDPGGEHARYAREPSSSPVEEDGRLVWIYTYSPNADER